MTMKENEFEVPCSFMLHDKLVILKLFIEALDIQPWVNSIGEAVKSISKSDRDIHLVLTFQILIQTKILEDNSRVNFTVPAFG